MQAGHGVGSAARESGAKGGWLGCPLPPPFTQVSLPCGFSLKPLQSTHPSRCHSAMWAVAPQQ